MGTTLTSSPSSSHRSTFSNTSNIDASCRSTSTTSHQSSERSSASDQNLSTCDSTSTGARPKHERDNSSQIKIKRFLFGDYNIDWKSIPTLDEDSSFNRATLFYRRDLRCKASRDYYMEILNGFRITDVDRSKSSDGNMVSVDDEEVFDMIG